MRWRSKTLRRVGGKSAVTVGALALAMGTGIAVAGPSQAAVTKSCSGWTWSNPDSRYGSVIDWNPIHSGPYAACSVVATPGKGRTVYYHCFVVNAYNNSWTHVRIAGTSTQGWIYDGDLDNAGSWDECPDNGR
ncbi:hypothetical protein GCM10023191_038710 [Actinoallomurus oryzae]|uniref:SH3 domain-containing protein n=2 Tax=Actinoallomurus oryzae TaxID=502180 RepID=A0ABP8Q2J5_9ACTN